MRTSLEVESTIADALRQMAKAQNISIDQVLSNYVPGLEPISARQNATRSEDKELEFEEWAASFPKTDASPLSDEAVGRASIYPDR